MCKSIGRFFREIWEGHLRMIEFKARVYSGVWTYRI